MPNFSMSTDVDVDVEAMEGVSVPSTIGMEGSIKRVSGELLVNYYPFKKGSFFLTAGAYFGGGTLLKINGHSDELKELVAEAGKAGVVIGDYRWLESFEFPSVCGFGVRPCRTEETAWCNVRARSPVPRQTGCLYGLW